MKANEAAAGRARPAPSRGRRFLHNVTHYRYLHLMVLPGLAFFLLFKYVPMYGIIIAFKNYKGAAGGFSAIMSAPWIGLKNFEIFFNSLYCERVFKNTIYLSILRLIFSFPAPILLALMINEIRANWFKRTVQTITYMPYFISLVVLCSLIKIYCQQNGLFSDIVAFFGGTKQNWLQDPRYFRLIYVLSDIWQGIGWNSIIYLAALSGIDQEQYEAARIDDANRFQQVLHVTLPGLLPTITILFILRMGNILNVGYEKILLLYQPTTYEVADVFSTYTYRISLGSTTGQPQYSLSTAVSLFNTLVNVCFLLMTNLISSKLTDSSLF